ncbi:MAG: hypothetical protein KF786_16840 [Burkholderiaceae bacterium]|jgi:hypothetical protein|nr:hypothetical protein [Burkholderiaceae bacterium]
MKPFWVHSGLALLDADAHGGLQVTDAFLRAYLERPELAPIDESCAAERALHVALLADPRRAVATGDGGDGGDGELASLADPDARENWRLFLRFRDRLLAAPNLQAAYVAIFADAQHAGRIDVPPLFVEQLAQIIVHHMLADSEDGLLLRVAELWFREQRVSLLENRVVLADLETVEARAADPGFGNLGRLLAQANVRTKAAGDVDLEVIDRPNAASYFGRDERHDFAVEITHGRTASAMFCDLVRRWIGHLLGVPVRVTTLASIEDARWRWHVGLDAQASVLLDKLYREEGLTPEEHRRILLLMRLDFERLEDQDPAVAGKPVYLALAADEAGVLRMKPQNLLFNLPLRGH